MRATDRGCFAVVGSALLGAWEPSINVTGLPSPIVANGVVYGSTGRTIEALTP
jgi:hypothetical protein